MILSEQKYLTLSQTYMKFNKLIPELSVSNLESSRSFYVDVVGFKIEYSRNEDKFLFLSLGDAQLMIFEDNQNWVTGKYEYPRGRGINFQIEVDSIDVILERSRKAKLNLFKEPIEQSRRVNLDIIIEKEFLVQDPDGYLLRFSSTISE